MFNYNNNSKIKNINLSKASKIRKVSMKTKKSLKLESKKSNLIFIKNNRTNNVQVNVKRLNTRLPIFISNYKVILKNLL